MNRSSQRRTASRRRAKPPELRSVPGAEFTAANLDVVLAMQQCESCRAINYPSREVCQNCLGDKLTWKSVSTAGRLINRVELHHSLGEFFKRRLKHGTWPIASVKMTTGPVVFAHLALSTFFASTIDAIELETEVKVFSHTDCGLQSVLVAVSVQQDISDAATRRKIVAGMGLLINATEKQQRVKNT